MPPRRLLLPLLLLPLLAPAAERLDRHALLVHRGTDGRPAPVRDAADWARRRAEIVAGAVAVMGPLPGADRRVPLDVRVLSETDCGTYVRREITYAAEPGGTVPAYLLVPSPAQAWLARHPELRDRLRERHPAAMDELGLCTIFDLGVARDSPGAGA